MAKHYKNKSSSMAEPKRVEGSGDEHVAQRGGSYYGSGHGDFANMPNGVVMSQYPQPYQSLDNDGYGDNIRAIDEDASAATGQIRSRRSRSMY